MSSNPFMQVYVADYTADTQHLTCEEDGAYWRLLRAMWRAGGHLPASDRNLARICGLHPKSWARMRETILAFFAEENGLLTQKRLAIEFQKALDKASKRAAAGAIGGRAKSNKINDNAEANAVALPKHSLEPEPESDSKTSSNEEDSIIPISRSLAIIPKSDSFALFWKAYPNKVGKRAAEKAYKSALLNIGGADPAAVLLSGLERARCNPRWEDTDFIPHPTTWLNQGRWADEPPEPSQTAKQGRWLTFGQARDAELEEARQTALRLGAKNG